MAYKPCFLKKFTLYCSTKGVNYMELTPSVRRKYQIPEYFPQFIPRKIIKVWQERLNFEGSMALASKRKELAEDIIKLGSVKYGYLYMLPDGKCILHKALCAFTKPVGQYYSDAGWQQNVFDPVVFDSNIRRSEDNIVTKEQQLMLHHAPLEYQLMAQYVPNRNCFSVVFVRTSVPFEQALKECGETNRWSVSPMNFMYMFNNKGWTAELKQSGVYDKQAPPFNCVAYHSKLVDTCVTATAIDEFVSWGNLFNAPYKQVLNTLASTSPVIQYQLVRVLTWLREYAQKVEGTFTITDIRTANKHTVLGTTELMLFVKDNKERLLTILFRDTAKTPTVKTEAGIKSLDSYSVIERILGKPVIQKRENTEIIYIARPDKALTIINFLEYPEYCIACADTTSPVTPIPKINTADFTGIIPATTTYAITLPLTKTAATLYEEGKVARIKDDYVCVRGMVGELYVKSLKDVLQYYEPVDTERFEAWQDEVQTTSYPAGWVAMKPRKGISGRIIPDFSRSIAELNEALSNGYVLVKDNLSKGMPSVCRFQFLDMFNDYGVSRKVIADCLFLQLNKKPRRMSVYKAQPMLPISLHGTDIYTRLAELHANTVDTQRTPVLMSNLPWNGIVIGESYNTLDLFCLHLPKYAKFYTAVMSVLENALAFAEEQETSIVFTYHTDNGYAYIEGKDKNLFYPALGGVASLQLHFYDMYFKVYLNVRRQFQIIVTSLENKDFKEYSQSRDLNTPLDMTYDAFKSMIVHFLKSLYGNTVFKSLEEGGS